MRLLQQFDFDILKIDGSCIRGIHRTPANQLVTASLLGDCQAVRKACVAESVETLDEARYLQALGVDCLQGYFIGAPTFTLGPRGQKKPMSP